MTISEPPPERQPSDSACALDDADAREVIEQSQGGHFVVLGDHIVYANPAVADMLGWPADELIGREHEVIVVPELRERARSIVTRRLAGKTGSAGQMLCLRRDGSRFHARIFAKRVRFAGQFAVLVTLYDTTELTDALQAATWNAEMLARTESLCRSGSFEVVLPDGKLVLSKGLRDLIECPDAAIDQRIDAMEWVPPDERDFVAGIWRNAIPGEAFDFQHRIVTLGGRRLVVLHRGRVESLPDGRLRGVALLQDITAQREAEQRLQELATHDEVTGLPNRAAFLDQLDAAIIAAAWDEHIVAVITIDVARIGEVKAKMGFGAGDMLAMALAARLKAECREGETVAQLGNTEFALMADLSQTPSEAAAAILQRACVLRDALEQPVRVASTDVFVQCVIGVASFPGDARQPAQLLELAQTARLRATLQNSIVVYQPDSNARALREMQIEALLRQALADDELEVHYQPQVEMADGRIVGAEALLRWTSSAMGRLAPSEFVPIAERSGLIGAVGDWVLHRVCRQIANWRAAGVPVVRIGVNVAPAQLQRRDLAGHVQTILLSNGVEPSLLGIEITEGTVMADVAHAAAVLSDIRAMGIEVSLDDFGTGYSSLSCLCSLPIDVVKIDRSFVHDVTAAPEDVSVTRAIITMAQRLQLQVLAEGVETEGQLGLLATNRCDRIQGHYFSTALPADAFAQLLLEDRRLPTRFVTRIRDSRTLLLVDDEEHVLASLRRLLRRDGYTIVTACGATEGLQRLTECEVDVIVSDQRMPGMTGVEFLRRAKELYPDTIRIVLSGYTELQSIIDAINEGAIYKFLTKPWDDARLRGHVAEAFRQKAMADENRRLARQVESANADYQQLNSRLERLVAQQRDEADVLSLTAGSTRDALECLPAPILAIDGDGVLAFANEEARHLLPGIAGEIGRAADEALPPALWEFASASSCRVRVVEIGGIAHRALKRTLQRRDEPHGSVLLLMPSVSVEDL
jgi:diguanylate cyclase (GGDEF)-like protein/PAS domain S-box-containing protein